MKKVNKFLLAGDKFIPQIRLKQPRLPTVLVDHLLKTRKEYKNLKKQEIKDISKRTRYSLLSNDMVYEDFKDLLRYSF